MEVQDDLPELPAPEVLPPLEFAGLFHHKSMEESLVDLPIDASNLGNLQGNNLEAAHQKAVEVQIMLMQQ